jgi:ribosome-associated protein
MPTVDQLRSEVFFQAVRSRGPGGQHVNRTSSAAQCFWDYRFSKLLNDTEKARVGRLAANSINAEGQVYLRSDEFRDLERNKVRCLEKLSELIAKCLHVPKRRRATKPTYGSKVRTREGKTRRSETKRLRSKVHD